MKTPSCLPGCRACEEACFAGAIRVHGGRAEISEACRGCGRCVTVCPNQAVSLEVSGHGLPEGLSERIA
ncbi:MAG: 4Fe-4S binding protein [Desulfatibacillum sp.]|nr:4Fe-4S binding protein [Desulfatibacillum sp.]